MILSCFVVTEARSRAIMRPRTETRRAAILRPVGIVSTGVLIRFAERVIRRPPKMLPQASRFRGLITAGLFSLMGERQGNRGVPMETKKITRKL